MMSLPAIELCALLVQDSQPFSVRQTNGTIAEVQVIGPEIESMAQHVLQAALHAANMLTVQSD